MAYDYYLLGGFFVVILGLLSFISALVDQRSTLGGIITICVGGGLCYYAWVLSEETLVTKDIPDAFFRVLAQIIN